jgi:two-component system response regulator DesR
MIRVLVAEDMRILRDTLVSVLNLEDDIKVVAQVAAGTGIVPAAIEHRPDVALLDIGMPGADGLSAAAELSRRLPDCSVVVLTSLETPDNRRRAAAAGVSGFLLKGVPAATLIGAVRSAARQAGSRRPG